MRSTAIPSLIVSLCLAMNALVHQTECYAPTFITRRSTMTMRKGRKSLKKSIKGGLGESGTSNMKPMGSAAASSSSARSSNWVPVAGLKTVADLPKEEGKVVLVETMADELKNAQTNPNGAVGVVNYFGKTFCLSSACTACKIPLTKAKVCPPTEETNNVDPRLACDFCSATYNLRTGEKVSDEKSTGGIFGGAVRGLFGSSTAGDLPVYDLGEKNGKVVIKIS